MSELTNNQVFAGYGTPALSAEVGTGDVKLQWRKGDGNFADLATYTVDTLVEVPAHNNLVYRVVLTGTAKATLFN
jgi:hypothetical protein